MSECLRRYGREFWSTWITPGHRLDLPPFMFAGGVLSALPRGRQRPHLAASLHTGGLVWSCPASGKHLAALEANAPLVVAYDSGAMRQRVRWGQPKTHTTTPSDGGVKYLAGLHDGEALHP